LQPHTRTTPSPSTTLFRSKCDDDRPDEDEDHIKHGIVEAVLEVCPKKSVEQPLVDLPEPPHRHREDDDEPDDHPPGEVEPAEPQIVRAHVELQSRENLVCR